MIIVGELFHCSIFSFRFAGSGVSVFCRRLLHLQRCQHQLIPMVVEQTVRKHASLASHTCGNSVFPMGC